MMVALVVIALTPPAQGASNKYARSRSPVESKATVAAAPIRDVYVVHFIIDGTNLTAFDRTLAAGKLPTIAQHFVEGGARFHRATSLFPTTSTTVYQSFATGLLPGHAGIPHLERFDRERREPVDYLTITQHDDVNSDLINLRALLNPDVADLDAPTAIFDLLAGHPTAAIYSSFNRGASFVHPANAPIAALWSAYVSGNISKIDQLAFTEVLDQFGGEASAIPRYTLVGLYSSDVSGHKYGPQSPEVEAVLVQFDRFLADFFALLEKQGIADKTFIIISADHGMHETGKLFRFQKALEAKGIVVKPKNPRKKHYALYAASRGVSSTHIYVRHNGGFEPIENPDVLRKMKISDGEGIDLIETILAMPATDLLVVRAGQRSARLFNHEGKRADIDCFPIGHEEYCSYRFDTLVGDPLGYAENPKLAPLLDGLPHSTRAWREATVEERYPDAVIELSQIFHDGRAGDAFITTRDRFGFRKVKRGNHGGATNDDMRVPLLIAGPSVPKGSFGAARAVDLYPLLVKWFGLKVPTAHMDGVDPFARSSGEDLLAAKLAALEQILSENTPLIKMIGVADFVRTKVHPQVPAHLFPKLAPRARAESRLRARQLKSMRQYRDALVRQRDEKGADEIVDDRYLADHIAITERALVWTQRQQLEMEDAISLLQKCRDTNASACQSL